MKNDISIHQRTLDQNAQLRISRVEYSTFEFPRHFHDYYTILLIERGANQGFTGRNAYTIGPGTLLVINPGEVHAGSSFSKRFLRFHSLTLDALFLKQTLAKNGLKLNEDLAFDNRPIRRPALAEKFSGFLSAFYGRDATMQQETLLLEFLTALFNDYNMQHGRLKTESFDLPYLKKAKDFIRENYQQELSLADLSRACHISEYHLIRQFHRYYGLTPFEFLRNYRIEQAKRLLQKTPSITQVAHSVGFFDHSHFLKNFKKMTGMLPSQYRSGY